jgi:lipid-A-disaccharide synthase-like uncharacterized protein
MTIELFPECIIAAFSDILAQADFSDLMDSPDWATFREYAWKIISTPFKRFDWWDVVGFFGQFLFFSRFIVQLIASEKKKRNVLPVSFWYLSICGAFISLLYFIHIGKLPLIVAGMASMAIYGRNLHIWFKRRTSRKGLIFATGAVPIEDDEDG